MFASLDEAQLEEVARLASIRHFGRGRHVFRERDRGDALYVVQDGRVKVMFSSENGREVIVSILGEGEYFGEMALLDSEARCASVVAMTPCTLLVIARSDFSQLLASSPELSRAMLRELTHRLRFANRTIGNLATLDVFGRVARFLLDSAKEQDGERVVTNLPTQSDIAAVVGASREMVNRALKELSSQGYIRQRGGQLVITESIEAV